MKKIKLTQGKEAIVDNEYFELPKTDSIWMQKYNKYQFDLEEEQERREKYSQESKHAVYGHWSQKKEKLMNYIDDYGVDRASTKIKTEEDQFNKDITLETREHIKDCGVNQTLPNKLKPPPYAEYLSSNTWKTKRDFMLAKCGNKCEFCGHNNLKDLQVHHNTYQSFPDEHSTDLVVLCKGCHHTFHKIVTSRSLKHHSGRTLLIWRGGKGKIKKCFLCGISRNCGSRRLKLKEHHHNNIIGEPNKRTILVCGLCYEVMKISDPPKEKAKSATKYIIRKKKDSRA
jgi:hypothetical protein